MSGDRALVVSDRHAVALPPHASRCHSLPPSTAAAAHSSPLPLRPSLTPLDAQQAVVVGEHMYVIGGGCFKPEQSSIDVYRLHLRTLVWELVPTLGDVPKSRVAHTCSYDAGADTIYLVRRKRA
jgi:Kelch motif